MAAHRALCNLEPACKRLTIHDMWVHCDAVFGGPTGRASCKGTTVGASFGGPRRDSLSDAQGGRRVSSSDCPLGPRVVRGPVGMGREVVTWGSARGAEDPGRRVARVRLCEACVRAAESRRGTRQSGQVAPQGGPHARGLVGACLSEQFH